MADNRNYSKPRIKRYWAGDADNEQKMKWQTLDELFEKQQRRYPVSQSPQDWKREFKKRYDEGRSPSRPGTFLKDEV